MTHSNISQFVAQVAVAGRRIANSRMAMTRYSLVSCTCRRRKAASRCRVGTRRMLGGQSSIKGTARYHLSLPLCLVSPRRSRTRCRHEVQPQDLRLSVFIGGPQFYGSLADPGSRVPVYSVVPSRAVFGLFTRVSATRGSSRTGASAPLWLACLCRHLHPILRPKCDQRQRLHAMTGQEL